jgi:hypothetical protein
MGNNVKEKDGSIDLECFKNNFKLNLFLAIAGFVSAIILKTVDSETVFPYFYSIDPGMTLYLALFSIAGSILFTLNLIGIAFKMYKKAL